MPTAKPRPRRGVQPNTRSASRAPANPPVDTQHPQQHQQQHQQRRPVDEPRGPAAPEPQHPPTDARRRPPPVQDITPPTWESPFREPDAPLPNQARRPVGPLRAEAQDATNLGNTATVNAQWWLQESPWRLTAGWTVLAALLAFGWLSRAFVIDWRMVALTLLLVDPLWGSIWRLAGGRNALLPLPTQARKGAVWLPYLRPGSPAAQLLGWDRNEPPDSPRRAVLPLVFRVGLPTLILPLAIGWVLGPQALWLTVAVIAVSGVAWVGRQLTASPPHVLKSLVTVTLPWTLMLGLLNLPRSHEMFGFHLGLIGLWTLHHWGQTRISRSELAHAAPESAEGARPAPDPVGIGLLAVADLGLGALLIIAQTPIWLAPLAICWLPTYLTLYQGKRADRLTYWWLAAMLLSSLAIGTRMS